MKTAKAVWRRRLVVRVRTETDRNYRWWLFQDEEPENGYIEETYTVTEPAYPKPVVESRRRRPHQNLSRGKLRRRLARAHLRGAELSQLVAEIKNRQPYVPGEYFGGTMVLGWNEKKLKERLGGRLFRMATRYVARSLIILDEFHFLMSPGFADFVAKCRSMGLIYLAPPAANGPINPRLLPMVIQQPLAA